jgi:hypothetical protein
MNMTEVISTKAVLTVGKAAFDVIRNAYKTRQHERVDSFFKHIEMRYEFMTADQRVKISESIQSPEGQEILAQFADAITQTSSERVRMAIALLYCNDPDFQFSEFDTRIFINGVTGITDHVLDFFIESINRPILNGGSPYNRHSISENSLPNINNIDVEIVYSYINELIGRRLLLPDPITNVFGDINGWSVTYGSSSKSSRMVSLLVKAETLIDSKND